MLKKFENQKTKRWFIAPVEVIELSHKTLLVAITGAATQGTRPDWFPKRFVVKIANNRVSNAKLGETQDFGTVCFEEQIGGFPKCYTNLFFTNRPDVRGQLLGASGLDLLRLCERNTKG